MKNSTAKILLLLFLVSSTVVVPAACPEETTELHMAARFGDLNIIEELFKQGANANATDIKNWTPLHIAATFDHANFISELVRLSPQRVNLDAQDANGATPLHFAVLYNNPTCVKTLLFHDANPNIGATNPKALGVTPLHLAVAKNYEQCAEILALAMATEVNICANKNWTPLHVAAEHSSINSIQILLHAGADVNALTDNQETPEDVARKRKRSAAARLLQEVSNYGCSAIYTITKNSDDFCSYCKHMFWTDDSCASLGCGHDFHAACMAKLISKPLRKNQHLRCPDCKTIIQFPLEDLNRGIVYRTVVSSPLSDYFSPYQISDDSCYDGK